MIFDETIGMHVQHTGTDWQTKNFQEITKYGIMKNTNFEKNI